MKHTLLKSLMVGTTFMVALSAAQAQGVLNKGNGAEPGSLDPHQISGTWESSIARDQFLSLYTEAADGSIIPGAAESHTVSDDGLVYTFTPRDILRTLLCSPRGLCFAPTHVDYHKSKEPFST